MRICVEARDLLPGDEMVLKGYVSHIVTQDDTTTITLNQGGRIALWSGDHGGNVGLYE